MELDRSVKVERDIYLNKTALDLFAWSALGALAGTTIRAVFRTKFINPATMAGVFGGYSFARNREAMKKLS
jgi:uncharacterized membrane protein YbjE (DUF340 family)